MSKDYLPQTAFSRRVDSVIRLVGDGLSYIWLALLCVIVFNVLLRYALNEGRIELEEIQWHLYSIGFLLGLSYAYQADAHIRVDILHEQFGPELRAWIELYGIFLFLLPFIALIILYGIPFTMAAWELGEISASPGGLAYRWLIKAMLPLGFGLLLATVIARVHRLWHFLFLEEAKHGSE